MRPSIVHVVVLGLATPALAETHDAPIIGGTPTTTGQFPNVVAIEVGERLCTGTLITPEWVLTAAHCVSPAALGLPTQAEVTARTWVHLGTVNLARSEGVTVHASDTVPHPDFDNDALGSHDVGLIRLVTPVTEIPPARLNVLAANAPVEVAVTKVGFGVTVAGGTAGVEHMVSVTSTSCMPQLGSDANLLCFSQTSGRGVCLGDSGSPAFAQFGASQVVVGVTSFADATCTQFGADTRTDAESAFILAHVPQVATCTRLDCAEVRIAGEEGDDGGGCDARGAGTSSMLAGIGVVGLLRRRARRVAAARPTR